MKQPQRIVILGAGFAGVGVARELIKQFPEADGCRITLVDQNNFFLFTPMLTEVIGGEVDENSIVTAVRSLSPRVTFEQGRIDRIDAAAKSVTITVGGGEPGVPTTQRVLQADHIVVALGSVTNFHNIQGLKEYSLTVDTVEDAVTIRNRALALMERADEEPDAGIRRELLTFIVGGGGFSGVESMAALNDLVRELSSHFPHVARDDIRTIIVQPGDRVLPELSPGLAHYAQSELEQRGVEVMLKTKLSAAGEGYVDVQPEHGGPVQRIPTHMLIWTGGVTPSPVIESAGLPLGRHHGIVVDACCRVQDHPGFWALGDCAEIPKPGGHGSYAPTAQNATREGPLVARNIASVARGEAPHPFVYQPVGELAIVGRRAGVASVYGVHLRGGVAWIAWRFIYLAKMPRMMQRAHVALNWLLDLAFGRDLVALPGVQAEAVSGRIADQREIVASR